MEEKSGLSEGGNVDSAEERAVPAFLFGTRIGKYEIGRRLGIGSMGVVYEGVRSSDRRSVAIKVLIGELAGKPVARARFLREGRLTARVRHPHIVEIIDAGEELERIYLVMELLEGEDLARRLQRSGAMPVAHAVDILVPVCEAVATGHRCGVTHRDLKPSNIFLTVKNGRTHPMVLDFGVAKAEDEAEAGDATGAGARVVFGTPMYLAPELIGDHRAAGPASDQYALGAILYESLTGEQPYAATDLDRLFRSIVDGDPPSPRAHQSEIPAELDRIVRRAMSRDPQARFPSVAELAVALLPFVSTPTEGGRLGRRRPPSSPAIVTEAAIPSPFIRTLIPEEPAESGPWFGAPESPEDLWDEEPSSFVELGDGDDHRGGGASPARLVPRPRIERRWKGAAILSAASLGVVALVFLTTSGRSPPTPISPRVERSPPPVGPPAPVVNRDTEPVPAEAAGPAISVALVPPSGPSPSPPRRERRVSSPAEPKTDRVPRERVSTPRPLDRESIEVRMHNGVPLLD
ncbi:MAG TPA: serine/threonine-protein kinase [Polyangia bacterium]|nr:serine/threonine-protein kinase [Polyangia bacterium]